MSHIETVPDVMTVGRGALLRDPADDSAQPALFRPIADSSPAAELWPSFVVARQTLEDEAGRLLDLDGGADDRRSIICHPRSSQPGLGLAPGIRVTLEVLRPGEATTPMRHNSSQVVFGIAGSGEVVVDGHARRFERFDVWNTPSMATYFHRNDTDQVQVRLAYSNAALLEKLNVHYVELDPPSGRVVSSLRDAEGGDERANAMPEGFDELFSLLDEDGRDIWLMCYERLVNPPVQPSPALVWPWRLVEEQLLRLHALGPDYRGRRLYLLFNPATGRTNGTSHSFFATMTIRPAGIHDRPHRHTAAAINYFFKGEGYSIVEGKRFEWKAGDLMLSAPGWAVHHHNSHDFGDVCELTIQDSPFHLAIDSLLWQEDLKQAPLLIGSHPGWQTNRRAVEPAGS